MEMICPECKGILKNLRNIEKIEGVTGAGNKGKKVLVVYSLLHCSYCKGIFYRNGTRIDIRPLEEEGGEA
jgi:hypothetical protein